MSGEPCERMLVHTACAFLGATRDAPHRGGKFLRAFVDDAQAMTLCAERESDALAFSGKVESKEAEDEERRRLVFFKRQQLVLTTDNMLYAVGVCAILAPSAAASLGACLRTVFRPLLDTEPLLATSLAQLQAALGDSMGGDSEGKPQGMVASFFLNCFPEI
ncbi:uncharacterized protein LOC144168196 [Haemaphysalis longicornis]